MMFYNRYRLLRKLGRGSFGEVWAAHDEVTDVEVAVKIYAALDNSGIEDFRSVYRNLSTLIHTNILRPDYYDVYEDRPFLVMPLCRGSVQEQVGDMSEQELWRFIRDVSSGLAYLHSHDVIHNDIKPANILINTYGDYVVSDPSIEEATATVAYCAPELFMMENLSMSNAIDIWALGATLYELMTGEKLFSGQGGVAQLNGAALPELPDIYSRELREIVLSCLARESENRVSAERLKTVASKSVLRYQVFDTVGKHSDRDVRTLLRQMPKIGGSGVINNVCSGKNITVKNTFADGNMRILYGVTDDYGNVLVDFVYDYCTNKYGAYVTSNLLTSQISGNRSCVNISVKSDYMKGLIAQFVDGDNALNKSISPRALSCSLDFRKGILDGLYATDGGNSNRIYTSSPELKDTLVLMLATMGIASNVNEDSRDGRLGKNTNYTVRWYTPNGRTQRDGVYKVSDGTFWFKIQSIEKIDTKATTSFCLEVVDDNIDMRNFLQKEFLLKHKIYIPSYNLFVKKHI